MISTLFLVVTLIGALFVVNAYHPLVRWGPLSLFSFLAGWLTSELPLHHIAWQVLASAIFVSLGALQSVPGQVAMVINIVAWVALARLVAQGNAARSLAEVALAEVLGPQCAKSESRLSTTERALRRVDRRRLYFPLKFVRPDVVRVKNVRYAPWGRRGLLDVYTHRDRPAGSPVLLQVHGGGWVVGNKRQQGMPLMTHLASLGWVCVAINYRLSPRATFPDHLEDVKRALVWIRTHISEYGGRGDFVAITGGSAGGHLCALTALTAGKTEYQRGFEEADTSVQAAVPFYGVYDLADREGLGRSDMRRFLERVVIKRRLADDPGAFERASPAEQVGADAPPFFVVHGRNDTLVPVAEARRFVEKLRRVSSRPVVYLELPGAQHAFEVFNSIRTAHVVRAVERFLTCVYNEWLETVSGDARRST